MEKIIRFLRPTYALNGGWMVMLKKVVLATIIGMTLGNLAASGESFAGIPDIYYPPDLRLGCQSDTSPDNTGRAYCIQHCDCEYGISYIDEIETTGCRFEFIIFRQWRFVDSCGREERHVQRITLSCDEDLGVAKRVVEIDPGSSGVRGNFDATFEIIIQNNGNAKLDQLFLEDPIAPGYGNAYLGIVDGGEPRITYTDAQMSPTIDIDFDGQSNTSIFTDASNCLLPGEKVVIQYTIEVNPNAAGRPDTARNQAMAGGFDPCMDLVTDLSDTGDETVGTNPGVLGDMGTSDDPTLLPLVCVGTGAKAIACNRHTNISLDSECSLDIPASMVMEGEDWGCDVFYEVMITDHHGRPIPMPIPGHYKGETLSVKVIDAVFGNSCWGTVLIEDKYAPTIICENDTIYCNAIDSLPDPVFFDNCDPNPKLIELHKEVELLTCDSQYTKRITRRYQAVDEFGNRSQVCRQVLLLKRIPLDSIKYPQDYTVENKWALKCNGNYPLDSAGHPSPKFTGAPSIGGIPIYPFYQYCNVSADYEDRIIKHGTCIKKIMRTWRVVEWICGRADIREVPQIIHIVDDEPPVLSCPKVDYVTTNGGYVCEADVELPPADVSDNCTAFTIDIHYPGGILKNQNGGRITLPFGVHDVIYVARDSCYNESRCTVTVEVMDHTPPVTVCDGFTTVGLNEFGEAHLYAVTLDDGTYDDCYLDSFAVRRMDMGRRCGNPDTLFKPYVRFCCEDVDSQNVMVVFRAWDKAGNYNDCMVEVEVQDKVPPAIYCPPNITVSCDFHFEIDSLGKYFGTIVQDYHDRQPIHVDDPHFKADGPLYDGHVLENCEVTIEEFTVDSITQCRTGFILRGFRITDRQGLQSQCYQKITVIDYDPFDSTDIVWPLDYPSTTCGVSIHPDSLPQIYGRPQVNDDKCNLIGMQWEDHVFSFVQDSLVCFKVLRKWKIIDWCNFRMVDNTVIYDSWHYEQIIKVNNTIDPEFTMPCDTVTVCTYDPDCEDGRVELTMAATDDCTPDDDLVWEYKIDAFRDGIIDDGDSGFGGFADATGDYPIGKHYIIWVFEDQCGNKAVCRQPFEVVNCKIPTAYCKNGIIVDLMPIDTNNDNRPDLGEIEIWAVDLDDNSGHSCGNPVTISFSPDTNDIVRTYNCDSIGMRTVNVYVTDRITGEQDFCVTFVDIQDNNNICSDTSGIISGIIRTEMSDAVHDVEVKVSGNKQVTGMFNGTFNFQNIPLHKDYVVRPSKTTGPLNGISTRDIVMLQRHLLGMESLDSPYKIIAADANGDDRISISDIVELRRLLLGHYADFQNVDSWRFVDAAHTFTDPAAPFIDRFAEDYAIRDMPGNMHAVDFTAIKVGDLDRSADPNGLGDQNPRSELTQIWKTESRDDRIVFIADGDMTFTGTQFTLKYDAEQAELIEVKGLSLKIADQHLGMSAATEGIVRVVYHSENVLHFSEGEELFSVKFDRTVNASSIELLDDPLESEMYDEDLVIQKLELRSVTSEFLVDQNKPNPFTNSTVVDIEVDRGMDVQFKVFDLNGRIFINQQISLLRGNNRVEIDRDDLGSAGIYYYQVGSPSGFVTKKMILMD
ncbi:MAG: T9SS type A sorting domain-containing protein [Saprospiraceae bacterium]|nr:T9SS type A sorting domain-containing protein [Saprospiraceae bacterium]